MSKWDNDLYSWWQYHREDYEAVRERLTAMRNVMLRGRESAAISALKKSTVWSVLSIQTERDRHEDAYVAWDNGLRLDEASLQTVYGGQKANWLKDRYSFDYERTLELLRQDSPERARDYIAENFTGLSYTKASFALAMLGIWELLCIDSQTKKTAKEHLGIETPKRVRDSATYNELSEQIVEAAPINDKPFMIQWASYDLARGEHSRHMAFYRSVLYQA